MMEYYSIVLPIKFKKDLGLVIRPFDPIVWISSLTTIPIFIAAMGIANYIFLRSVKWGTVSGFALRIVMEENAVRLYEEYVFQKILTIVWLVSFFVLSKSYSGDS